VEYLPFEIDFHGRGRREISAPGWDELCHLMSFTDEILQLARSTKAVMKLPHSFIATKFHSQALFHEVERCARLREREKDPSLIISSLTSEANSRVPRELTREKKRNFCVAPKEASLLLAVRRRRRRRRPRPPPRRKSRPERRRISASAWKEGRKDAARRKRGQTLPPRLRPPSSRSSRRNLHCLPRAASANIGHFFGQQKGGEGLLVLGQ